MERLDSTAARAMRALLDPQPTTDAKVKFAWAIAAGPSLARAATISWSDDGALAVYARSEAWRLELVRARPTIAARLTQLLGAGVVHKITISCVPLDQRPNDRQLFR